MLYMGGFLLRGIRIAGSRIVVRAVVLLVTAAMVLSIFGGGLAFGAAAPAWSVTDLASPTVLSPKIGTRGRYAIIVENVGSVPGSGDLVVKARIPTGFSVTSVGGEPEAESCVQESEEVSCTFSQSVVPSGFVVMTAFFEVTGSLAGVESSATASGGGASAPASDVAVMHIAAPGETTGPPGVAQFRLSATGPAGEPITQAGEHSHFLTTSVSFNSQYISNTNEPVTPVRPAKDLVFYLPIGMLGNPAVTEPCPVNLVQTTIKSSGCPPASRVGTALPAILNTVPDDSNDPTLAYGIYSVKPEHGYAAEFAFASTNIEFVMYANVVRRDGTYVVRVTVPGVPRIANLLGVVATFYGDITEEFTSGGAHVQFDRGAFLTDPSDCEVTSLDASVAFNTWEDPDVEEFPYTKSEPAFSRITDCELLDFSANIDVRPETTQADSPSGYEVGLNVPQAPNGGTGLGTPPVRDVSLTLPQGTTISPSSANGLEACRETGPEGIDIEGSESEEVGVDGVERAAPGHCPKASAIGQVSAETPLLREKLSGHMFLAQPECGGAGQGSCTPADAKEGKLFGLYLELEAPASGVFIKLKGHASVDPNTGQITAVFNENPQFPFSNLTVTMKEGARAPLANSQTCGVASSSAKITPWSAAAGEMPNESNDFFDVSWNGDGEACPTSPPFAPSFRAQTTSYVAGTTSPFTLTLNRQDREQDVESLSTTLPEGMLAKVAKVVQCPEPLASEDSLSACPAASQIGTTTVAVGSGSDPYYVTGKVFFTGQYDGGQFGLSVVVPAVAGPFNLGDVIVRVALFVNPNTSQVTAVSRELPQMLDGVPLRLKSLNVTLENREFVLNPTNCSVKNVTGTVYSPSGGAAAISSPFAASDCGNLSFDPVASGSTEALSTKSNGTGVNVKIAYPKGYEANIAKVVLSFPKQLPVRLNTLHQACVAATFEANPAACPPASAIGTAVVHTPILAQPLSGPVYLVSHGSAKFPDVEIVLQGENGVMLDVDGQSFVSNEGVLQVTFASVPDAPFSTFETTLPARPYSEFTSTKSIARAKASQCGETLIAPVTMTAQNGAQSSQNVKLAVNGCGPTVSVGKANIHGHTLTVSVTSSARGRLTIGGPGLRRLVKRGVAAGTHRFVVVLTSKGRRLARAHRKIQITARLVVGKKQVSNHKRVTL